MKYLRRKFITGLLILLPAVVTGWILWKVFHSVDNLLVPIQQRYPIIDHPGIGFVVVIVIVLMTGIFAGNFIGHRLISRWETIIRRLPIIRRIYIAVKELGEVFLNEERMAFKKVVLIRYPHRDSYALGFVTEKAPPFLVELTGREMVNVFIPTTPNPTSGFLLMVPADDVRYLPLDVEQALKMVVSGGVYLPPILQQPGTQGVTPQR